MFSFRSILLAVAAFATIASAIPTAPPSNDARGVNTRFVDADVDFLSKRCDDDYDAPGGYRRSVDADSDFLSKRASVNAKSHFNEDIPILPGIVVGSDPNIVIRSPVDLDAENSALRSMPILPIKRGQASRSVNAKAR